MDEDLLGYLLGALEPPEMRRVEERLRVDHSAREELERIERALRPLNEAREPDECPPPDLVSRTLESLPPLPAPPSQPAAEPVSGFRSDAAVDLTPMGSAWELESGSSRGWADGFVAAIATAILLGLLLPSIVEGRFNARRVACQNQLRELGTAITQFVLRNEQERLPAVAKAGPEAFAGVYAVRLNDSGLLRDSSIRWCPSVGSPDAFAGSFDGEGLEGRALPLDSGEAESQRRLAAAGRLISIENLHRAPIDELQSLQRFAGGHYAYSLGVVDGRQYGSPRYRARSNFAVLSDAPLGAYDRDGLTSNRIGHAGRGINVLYESGQVRFIPLHAIDSMPDHPLFNLRGDVEAGVNIDDAVLAPSWRGPFLHSAQR